MSRLWPTAAEAASLRFLVALPDPRTRLFAAAGLFAAGTSLWCLAPRAFAYAGLPLLLAGHLPLWVRRHTTAPGGATPAHENVWAPVEDGWLERVQALERRGEQWDTTPWDFSNKKGCLSLIGILLAVAAGGAAINALFEAGLPSRLPAAALLLLVPQWFNGMRTVWNPSELRKKGEALAVARAAAEESSRGDFDFVPMLALREGRRGRYPVDARLMLRPSREDGTGFLGVQIQVAMNNVRGTDYPYLYAVVLGMGNFRITVPQETGPRLLCEQGEGEGVRYLVIRQHADTSGGWHTEPERIRAITVAALETARELWRANGGKPAA